MKKKNKSSAYDILRSLMATLNAMLLLAKILIEKIQDTKCMRYKWFFMQIFSARLFFPRFFGDPIPFRCL